MSEYIHIDNAVLHKSESGVRDFEAASPASYAQELARYISCPTTIRARVLDEFDSAPHIRTIQRFQAEHKADRERYRAASDNLVPEPGDIHGFRVRRLARWPFEKDAPPKPKPPQFPDPIRFTPGVLPVDIIREVAAAFDLTYADIMSNRRVRPIMLARRTAAYILFKRGNSYPKVAQCLGLKCHSTIIHAVEQFESRATARMREVAAAIMEARG